MKSRYLIAIVAVLALFAGACSENEPEADTAAADTVATSDSDAVDEPEPAEEEPEPAAVEPEPAEEEPEPAAVEPEPAEEEPEPAAVEPEPAEEEPEPEPELAPEVQWAVDYVDSGADSTDGEPVVVGFAISEAVTPTTRPTADATAAFINDQLGGIEGRPLEIDYCDMATPESGAACAAQFANNDDVVAVLSTALVGNGDLNNGLAGLKPVYAVAGGALEDFTTPGVTVYSPGALGAGLSMALFIASTGPESVGAVVTDDDAGRTFFGIFAQVLGAAGVELIPVFVAPTATSPEIESALQAVGAGDLDALAVALFPPGCVSAVDAMANLGIDPATDGPTVVTTQFCYDPSVRAALTDAGAEFEVPNGWYYAATGYNPFLGSLEGGVDTINAIVIDTFGEDALGGGQDSGVVGPIVISKILNTLDGDYAAESVEAALRGYTGTVPNQAGTMECGISPLFVSVCGTKGGVHRFLNGDWIAIAEGDNGIDLAPVLNPGG